MKKVSIVCPFRNEEGIIKEAIQSYINQTYKNKEIILVDNSDPNNLGTEIAKKYAKKYKYIKYYYIHNIPGKWAAHYYIEGIKKATGDILYLADANAKIPPNYLALTVPLIKGKVAGIVGKVTIWPDKSPISKYRDVIWTLKYNNTNRINREINEGRIFPRTLSKKVYNEIGGFKPDAGWAIDTYFNKDLLKKGYKIVYEPKAIWWHKWRDDPKDLIKYSFKFGKLNYDLAKTDKKQLYKISYFLLPFIVIIASIFNIKILLLLIFHPLPIIFSTFKIFLRAKNNPNRKYVFLKPLISYMQNIPYSLGFIQSLFRDIFKYQIN